MYLIQVTLLATATPIAPPDIVVAHNRNFHAIVIQNNSAAVVRVGDSAVSATKGIVLAAGGTTTQPPLVLTPVPEAESLTDWYLFGSVGDLIDVLVIT